MRAQDDRFRLYDNDKRHSKRSAFLFAYRSWSACLSLMGSLLIVHATRAYRS